MYKCAYFSIKELVSPLVYNTFGEEAWMFFDEDFLKDIDTIRQTWGSSLKINDGNSFTESGLRTNIDYPKKTLYCSAHTMGKAVDLKDTLGRNSKLFAHICKLITQGKLKTIKRVENPKTAPTWCHVDCFQTPNGKLQVFMG